MDAPTTPPSKNEVDEALNSTVVEMIEAADEGSVSVRQRASMFDIRRHVLIVGVTVSVNTCAQSVFPLSKECFQS